MFTAAAINRQFLTSVKQWYVYCCSNQSSVLNIVLINTALSKKQLKIINHWWDGYYLQSTETEVFS